MAKTRFDVARVSVWIVHQGIVMEDLITSLIGYYGVIKKTVWKFAPKQTPPEFVTTPALSLAKWPAIPLEKYSEIKIVSKFQSCTSIKGYLGEGFLENFLGLVFMEISWLKRVIFVTWLSTWPKIQIKEMIGELVTNLPIYVWCE